LHLNSEFLGFDQEVLSPNTRYTPTEIHAEYMYSMNNVVQVGNKVEIRPSKHKYQFKTQRTVPKHGVMMVGWGGNNGSTITGGIIANKLGMTWRTKGGVQKPNYFGSLTQATTIRVGSSADGKNVHVPFKNIAPMVSPNDLVIGGWDISKMNIADSMHRAEVLDWDLQRQLVPYMKDMVPLPSVYYPDFIAANQEDRADNVLTGTKAENVEQLRKDIREFKAKNGLDSVTVLWTANTERFVELREGLNDTADNILAAIERGEAEVSPSQIFAVAAIKEGCTYINCSPQNTLVPAIVELAQRHGTFVCGDDLKSGQTKIKSVLVDFLVSSGIKPESIVSYNHLGNNDGKNLSAPQQFRSKEVSKSNVVDDMVAANRILFPDPESKPDHCVVIKYVPFVKDSKRALDEYSSSIFMNGLNTISIHNTCEDSLLAAPLVIDLVILSELMSRITYKTDDLADYQKIETVLSICSYLMKAPMVPQGTPVINALFKQHRKITNLLCAALGMSPDDDMLLEHFTKLPKASA
jgi:myo-inositol-1-phosphate synthase